MRLNRIVAPLAVLVALSACLIAQEQATEDAQTKDPRLERVAPETVARVQEAQRQFQTALQATGSERINGLKRSLDLFRAAAEADDALPPAQSMWAKLLFAAGDQRSAKAALQRAVVEHPYDPEAYVLLANLADSAGQYVEASLAYDAALRLIEQMPNENPRRSGLEIAVASGKVAVTLAQTQLANQMGRKDLVQKYYGQVTVQLKRWLELEPNNASIYERLAESELAAGRIEDAEEYLIKAKKLNPSLPSTNIRLAQSMLGLGKLDAAKKRVEQAVAQSPNDLAVQVSAADLLLALGENESAARSVSSALKIAPKDLMARRLETQLLRFQGKRAEAAEKLTQLHSDHPTDFETANALAQTLSMSEDQEERKRAVSIATVNAQRFDAKSVQGRRARITLAWTIYQAGNKDAAQQMFTKLLAGGIPSGQISSDDAYFVAEMCVAIGKPELAVPMLDSALGRFVQFPKRADAEALREKLQ